MVLPVDYPVRLGESTYSIWMFCENQTQDWNSLPGVSS